LSHICAPCLRVIGGKALWLAEYMGRMVIPEWGDGHSAPHPDAAGLQRIIASLFECAGVSNLPARISSTSATTARSSPCANTTGRYCSWRTATRHWRAARAGCRTTRSMFNWRRNPFKRAQHHSNTCNDWFLERTLVIEPLPCLEAIPQASRQPLSTSVRSKTVNGGWRALRDRVLRIVETRGDPYQFCTRRLQQGPWRPLLRLEGVRLGCTLCGVSPLCAISGSKPAAPLSLRHVEVRTDPVASIHVRVDVDFLPLTDLHLPARP
jgi:hypothetical protein